MDLTQISLGLDIATAVSVIGTGLWLVFNLKQQNKKKIGEERELERVQNLLFCQKNITSFNYKLIASNKEQNSNSYTQTLQELHTYLLYEARPCLHIFCPEQDIDALELAINAIETLSQGSVNLSSVDVIKKIAALELSLMSQIRKHMNNEDKDVSERMIKNYSMTNYGEDLSS